MNPAPLSDRAPRFSLSGRELGSMAVFSLMTAAGWVAITSAVIIPFFQMFSAIPSTLELNFYALMFFRFLIFAVILVFSVVSSLDLVTSLRRGTFSSQKPVYLETKVSRFSLWQRIQHWWLFITVATAGLTGFARIDPLWGRTIVNFLGGDANVLDIHLVAGFGLGVLAILHAVRYGSSFFSKLIRHQKIKIEIWGSRKDFSDFIQTFKYAFGRTDEYPKFGKYSYIQKFDYWAVYWGIVILGIPGVLMWLYGRGVAGGAVFIFHAEEALLAIVYIVMIHLYHTHFNPRKFPLDTSMIVGYTTAASMKEEHPLQFDEAKPSGKEG